MSKRLCVGLAIVTDLPFFGRTVMMQKRGVFDPERMDWETWPDHLQVSCYGCCQETDLCPIEALLREAREELGPDVAAIVEDRRADLKLLLRSEDDQQMVILYGLLIADCEWLKRVRLHPATGGLYPFNREHRPPLPAFAGHDAVAYKALDLV